MQNKYLFFYSSLFYFLPFTLFSQSTCNDPGAIISGASTVLDANSDGYFSSYNSSGFTLSRNEITEFEVLTGAGGDDLAWTALGGGEPAEVGCGNTDIVTDTDGGNDYAYYTVVDPDGLTNNGDEFLAFAIRVAKKTTGAFGFSYLMDSDSNCDSGDGDNVCGNPCFEYEIQLSTSNSGGDVELYNINGCYGTSDCNTAFGGDATICNPCNSEGIQVCVDSTICGNGGALWVYYINFNQIPGVNSTTDFSLTPASNTSGNQIIYKSANVSDYGGIDDINDIGSGSCGCTTLCSGSSCSNCEQDCALACASTINIVNPILPVDWMGFKGIAENEYIHLSWEVANEINNRGFYIERLSVSGNFIPIGFIPSKMSGREVESYDYEDLSFQTGKNTYRIKQVDIDGASTYSTSIEVFSQSFPSQLFINESKETLFISIPTEQALTITIFNLEGKQLLYTIKTSGTDPIHIPVSGFSKGLIFVDVRVHGKVLRREKLLL